MLVKRLVSARLGDVGWLILLGNRTPRAFVFSRFLVTYSTELRLRLWRWYFLNTRCYCVMLCFPVFCGVAPDGIVLTALLIRGLLIVWLIGGALRIH
jgi:hypothetical protein